MNWRNFSLKTVTRLRLLFWIKHYNKSIPVYDWTIFVLEYFLSYVIGIIFGQYVFKLRYFEECFTEVPQVLCRRIEQLSTEVVFRIYSALERTFVGQSRICPFGCLGIPFCNDQSFMKIHWYFAVNMLRIWIYQIDSWIDKERLAFIFNHADWTVAALYCLFINYSILICPHFKQYFLFHRFPLKNCIWQNIIFHMQKLSCQMQFDESVKYRGCKQS